jgi:hypothetical protein
MAGLTFWPQLKPLVALGMFDATAMGGVNKWTTWDANGEDCRQVVAHVALLVHVLLPVAMTPGGLQGAVQLKGSQAVNLTAAVCQQARATNVADRRGPGGWRKEIHRKHTFRSFSVIGHRKVGAAAASNQALKQRSQTS